MMTGLDEGHPLLGLAGAVDWPAPRLLWGLHLLSVLRGLHDEDLLSQWIENPYFQAFCGETSFQRVCPVSCAQLERWRADAGAERLDAWVALVLPAPRPEQPRTFVIDIDGVVAMLVPGNDYRLAQPIAGTIEAINRLYERGHRIVMLTARGSATGLSWEAVTREQLTGWGLKFHELRFGKPAADYYVDDRLVSVETLRSMAAGLPFPPSSRAPRLSLPSGDDGPPKGARA